MTTLDSASDLDVAAPPITANFLVRLWRAFLARRRQRRIVYALSELDARLLRDIGLEPLDVHEAVEGRLSPGVLFQPMRRGDDR